MTDVGEKARDEFLSEAQEILDRLSRDLLLLDATTRVGPADPEVINSIFRAVHTLKGLSGLFNASRLGTLSHELENLLDNLRLGRAQLTSEVLDLLFHAMEVLHRLLVAEKTNDATGVVPDLDAFIRTVRLLSASDQGPSADMVPYELDPNVLAVLTEYEEHRLFTAVQQGSHLYQVRVSFELATIDDGLETIKSLLKPYGEILTYLPSGTGASADRIELEILMASSGSVEPIRAALIGMEATVAELPRKRAVAPHDDAAAEPHREDPARASVSVRAVPPHTVRPTVRPARASLPMGPVRAEGGDGALVGRPDVSLQSVAQTVRVDIQRLDHLMNLLGELGLVRGALSRAVESVRHQPSLRDTARELARLHHAFERHLAAMQAGILEVRMVPLSQVFEKLARVARQASREVRKDVSLVITGADTEVDKLIGEALSDPLMHMIRNALDHGIESREQRERAGKPAEGTIALNAYQRGNQVVVEVEDDGGGIDPARLVERALAGGLVHAEEARDLGKREALALVFLPGLTTRTGPDQLSGRGVGMDVVKTNISALGGTVDVESEVGIGSKFTLTLPTTLAIVGALMIRVAGYTYALPLASVQEALKVDASAVRGVEGREIITLRSTSLPLVRLDRMFGLRSATPEPSPRHLLIVVASASSRRVGMVVDDVLGRQDIVIKALTGPVRKSRGFVGATDLGNQRLGLVVDIPSLIEEAFHTMAAQRMLGAGLHE